MNETLRRLVIQLGLDNRQLNTGIRQTQSTMMSFASKMRGILAGVLSYQAIKGAITAYQEFNMQIAHATQLLGGNVGEIAAMGRAMQRFGGDTNSVVNAMKSMQGHIQNAKFGQGALFDIAKKYGLSLNLQSTEKGILSLAKSLKGLDRNTRNTILSQLGLDEAMQRAFADGGVALESYIRKQKAIGVETEEDIATSRAFNNAILDMKDMFAALSREMIRGIMPLIRGFVEILQKFIEALRKNKAFVVAFFIGLGLLMLPILAILAKMAIASMAAFAPFYIIGAIIVAVCLIVEDLYYYFMGWDSVTGDLVKRFPILAKVIEPLRPLVMAIAELFGKIMAWFKDPSVENFKEILKSLENVAKTAINTIFDAFDNLFKFLKEQFPALTPLWDGMAAAFKAIKNLIFDLYDAIKNFFSALLEWNFDGMLNAVKDAVGAVLDFLKDTWGAVAGIIPDFAKKGFNAIFGGGNSAPSVPNTSTNTNYNSNVANNVNLTQNFNGAANPQQVGAAAKGGIDSVLSQVQAVGNGYE